MSKPKTDKQRAAVHLWMRQCAQVLNEQGATLPVVIDKLKTRNVDLRITEDSFKESVYKPVFSAMSGAPSTEDATTVDHSVVVEGLQKFFAQELGIVLPPFPCLEEQRWEAENG